jgi:ABC-2 type transport system ATP-binding protein
VLKNIIEVNSLVKKYKKSLINSVDGISFNVKEGEFFAFLGPNGAGKTTTISILTTTLQKTSGEIKIDGLDINKESSQIREKIGIIFQKPSIDENLNAEENIRFHCILYGLYNFAPSFALMPKEYKEKIFNLAEIIGIKENLFQPLKTYSGGMKRKLEIIRSLMHSPKILFLDEPTVGLDPESRKNLWNYIQKIRKELVITVFLTTHYLDEAEGADRVCIINKGKIVAEGSPLEIKRKLAYEHAKVFVAKGDEKKLLGELQALGMNGEVKEKYVEVIISSYQDIKNIITQTKTNILDFDIQKPTLEDAYIGIIKDEIIS